MKTKVFYGNQHIKNIEVTGKKGGGFRRFCANTFKMTMFVSALYGAGWMSIQLFPRTVAAEPIIKEVQVHVFPPMLQRICNSEVTGSPKTPSYQFNKDGSVVRGKKNRSDIGYCMINEPIWNDKARTLGYDIYTEQGNKDMALWIFENYGNQPWYLSEFMWSDNQK